MPNDGLLEGQLEQLESMARDGRLDAARVMDVVASMRSDLSLALGWLGLETLDPGSDFFCYADEDVLHYACALPTDQKREILSNVAQSGGLLEVDNVYELLSDLLEEQTRSHARHHLDPTYPRDVRQMLALGMVLMSRPGNYLLAAGDMGVYEADITDGLAYAIHEMMPVWADLQTVREAVVRYGEPLARVDLDEAAFDSLEPYDDIDGLRDAMREHHRPHDEMGRQ